MLACYRRFVLLGSILGVACNLNAPHDNPLDPFWNGSIEGRILTRRATGISSAWVTVPAVGRSAVTDSLGWFFLLGLPADTVKVFVFCPGYAPDSAQLQLVRGQVDTLFFYLNGLPYFQSCSLTTHVYGRSWPPDPVCFLNVSARVSDWDGSPDIDSVWCEIPAVGFAGKLDYNPGRKIFLLTLGADSLPGQNLDTLVGQKILFRAVDREGAVVTEELPGITRLMRELPVPLFPSGVDTVYSDTNFVWQRYGASFHVRYRGEVVRIEGGGPAGVVATFETYRPEDTVQRFDYSLLRPGDYYWTLEVIDRFGNSSRSAEELFRVR